MTATLTAARPSPAAARTARTARLDQARAALKAAGWTAQVVRLDADERAEQVRDYGTEGV